MDSQDNYEMSDTDSKALEWGFGDIWRSNQGILYRIHVVNGIPRVEMLQPCGTWVTSSSGMGQLPHTPMRRKCAARPPAEAVAWMISNPGEAVVDETGTKYHYDGVFRAGGFTGCVPTKLTRPVRGYW